MLSRIHNKLGTAGLVVAIVALVAALGGAAYAASDNHLSGGEKKEVKKIAKSVVPKGPTGAQGPAGAPGKDGAKGATGPEGKQGIQGIQGEEGPKGPEGSPWTAGGTLPSGKTETGVWGSPGGVAGIIPFSFTLPLQTALTEADVHVLEEGEGETTECPGTAENPQAAVGNLCVYTTHVEGEGFEFKTIFFGVFPSLLESTGGVSIIYSSQSGTFAWGSWAVTAP